MHIINELLELNQKQNEKIKELEQIINKQVVNTLFVPPSSFPTIDIRGYYWNTHQDRKLFLEALERVDDCIKIASKYNGRVFGGFLRNVLIPRYYNDPCPGYKDVDIWFTNKEQADFFVKEMNSKLAKIMPKMNTSVSYPFTREQYYLLEINGTIGNNSLIIDVIISKECPVNDLNVNTLTFNWYEEYKSFGKDETKFLMESIRNKKAVMLPGYDFNHFLQKERLLNLNKLGWEIKK